MTYTLREYLELTQVHVALFSLTVSTSKFYWLLLRQHDIDYRLHDSQSIW